MNDVDTYIEGFPPSTKKLLKQIRTTIKKAAPKASERISYGMPCFEYGGSGRKGWLVSFAAFKNHISLFISPSVVGSLKDIQKYRTSKATYQFLPDKPIPFVLIGKTVETLVKKKDKKNKEN